MQTNAKGAEELVNKLKASNKSKAEIIKALAEYCLDWPYVYAAAGEMCTPEWRKNRMGYSDTKYANAIKTACPVLNGTQTTCAGCKWYNCRCYDCRGFTRWLLAQVDITLAGGGATSQYGTNSNWVIKGTIDRMPKNLICCVFKYKDGKMSHTGMSMGDGNGDIIHCSTIVKHGNVFTDIPKWTHFGIPAGLYTTEELRQAGIVVDNSKNFPSLRKGSTGSIVTQLQKFLNDNYNANLKIDGKFGSKTEEAVKKFQRENGLTADGVVGQKTWIALKFIPSNDDTNFNDGAMNDDVAINYTGGDNMQRTLRKGDTGGSVVKLQDSLNRLCQYNLKLDGIFGENTETAVADYQHNNNLFSNGIVDESTWDLIEKQLKEQTEQVEIPINDNRMITLSYDVANTFFEELKIALGK